MHKQAADRASATSLDIPWHPHEFIALFRNSSFIFKKSSYTEAYEN